MQEHTKLFKSIPHNPPKYIGLQYVVNQGLYIVTTQGRSRDYVDANNWCGFIIFTYFDL